MTALLTSEKDNTDKVVEYVKECGALGINVLPPDVNHSLAQFTVENKNAIRYGLLAVKNIGAGAIESMIHARTEGGLFTSIFDFCRRIDLRLNNRKVLESLIKSGAFDAFNCRRAQMMAVLEKPWKREHEGKKKKRSANFRFLAWGRKKAVLARMMKPFLIFRNGRRPSFDQ